MDDYIGFDWQRILIGDAPLLFTIEILVRTALMYGYAVVVMRLMSKRGASELTPFSLVIIIAMGSAVGDPMLYPDVPLLHGFAVVTGVLVMERVLAEVARRSERAEAFIHGVPHQVVDEGRIDVKGTAIESMPREELLSELRVAGIEQLGQVKRAFLEESAKISVFRYAPDEVRPGLPLVPPWDIKRPEGFGKDEVVTPDGYYSCAQCGETRFRRSGENFGACPHCDDNGEWMVASAAGVAGIGQVAGNTGSD